jgi:hypothetical protein
MYISYRRTGVPEYPVSNAADVAVEITQDFPGVFDTGDGDWHTIDLGTTGQIYDWQYMVAEALNGLTSTQPADAADAVRIYDAIGRAICATGVTGWYRIPAEGWAREDCEDCADEEWQDLQNALSSQSGAVA